MSGRWREEQAPPVRMGARAREEGYDDLLVIPSHRARRVSRALLRSTLRVARRSAFIPVISCGE